MGLRLFVQPCQACRNPGASGRSLDCAFGIELTRIPPLLPPSLPRSLARSLAHSNPPPSSLPPSLARSLALSLSLSLGAVSSEGVPQNTRGRAEVWSFVSVCPACICLDRLLPGDGYPQGLACPCTARFASVASQRPFLEELAPQQACERTLQDSMAPTQTQMI